VPSARFTALAALAALGVSCSSGPPPAIDPTVAARVPSSTLILGGVNLHRLRASPLYRQLPPSAALFLQPLKDADSLLVASNGIDYLALTHGGFREAPPGETLLAPGVAAAGSSGWLAAAAKPRSTPRPAVLDRAEPLAASSEIWMVVAGGATLPLTGNAENINRLLHSTQYTTLSIRLIDNLAIEMVGVCTTADAAQQLEGTVRAMVNLAAAAEAHQAALAGLLKRIRITREDRAVHLRLSADAGELGQILGLL
jgi:hypothetical protein